MAHDHEAVMKREAIAYWAADPLNRPVKVTAILRDPMLWTEGFVTCYKFVAGRTLGEAESILGLPIGELAAGAGLVCHDLEFSLRQQAHASLPALDHRVI